MPSSNRIHLKTDGEGCVYTVKQKKNYYIEEWAIQRIEEIAAQRQIGQGAVVELLVESFDNQTGDTANELKKISQELRTILSVLRSVESLTDLTLLLQNNTMWIEGISAFQFAESAVLTAAKAYQKEQQASRIKKHINQNKYEERD